MRIETVGDEVSIVDWQHVHNVIVPPAAMTIEEVRDNLQRRQLEVAYLRDVLVGCTTVRPPEGLDRVVTVIARVLPEHRRQGLGTELYSRLLGQARELGAGEIETVVLESNTDGLRFAQAHGFTEVSSYLPEGEDAAFLTMRLARA